jgi:TolA-binding protein
MDKFKDPAMLLSIADAVGLVGVTFYFYKQLETMRSDINKTNQNITKIVAKLGEMEKGDQNKNEMVQALNDQMKRLGYEIDDLSSLENNITDDIEEIIKSLESNNIIIERPGQKSKYKSGDRKQRPRNEPENKREKRTEERSSKNWNKQKQSFADNKDDRLSDVDDDEELINSVRRQQTRN